MKTSEADVWTNPNLTEIEYTCVHSDASYTLNLENTTGTKKYVCSCNNKECKTVINRSRGVNRHLKGATPHNKQGFEEVAQQIKNQSDGIFELVEFYGDRRNGNFTIQINAHVQSCTSISSKVV